MGAVVWQKCLIDLEDELSLDQFNTYIRPLQADVVSGQMRLLAPNKYILEKVNDLFISKIRKLVKVNGAEDVSLHIGSFKISTKGIGTNVQAANLDNPDVYKQREHFYPVLGLNKDFTFDTFVEGKSNAFARASAVQVSENIGKVSKCLLLYGGVGLGKTHLMHAVGNAVAGKHPRLKIVCMYAQRFMEDLVRAIKRGVMSEFTQYYRSVDVLLMDDIQFLTKGVKTQEEFFHVFNRLQENGSQIVLTCDRYPKEVDGLEERLKSRFVWGMTAPLELPDLETRVAILIKKAELEGIDLSQEVAFFIAEKLHSNVRELEGALRRVSDNSTFTGQEINIPQVKVALKDLLAVHERQVGIDSIQKTVADYYKIRLADMHTKKRSRSVARPRQLAMALAKELTSRSLPEIGDSFGGRDHTTVLHACRKIEALRETSREIQEDYNNLLRRLTA